MESMSHGERSGARVAAVRRWILGWLVVMGCTPGAPSRGTEASVASAPPSSLPSALPAESAVPVGSAAAPASSSVDAGVAEVVDAGGRPVCRPEQLRGEVTLPSAEGLPLTNAAPDASVDRGYAELLGALSAAIPGLRCCYTEASGGKALAGTVHVEVGVGPEGRVKSVSRRAGKSDINEGMLGACVEATLREVVFPASRRGQPTTLVLPILFGPGGGH